MLASILVSLLALACLGRRWPFAVSLAALMLSYGGWSTLQRTGTGDRTRSYFGIYEVSQRYDGTVRVLTHGTTLHGMQNLEPGLETEPTTYYARRSGVGLAFANADALFGANSAPRRRRPRQRHALLLRPAQPELDASSRSIRRWSRSPATASPSSSAARRRCGSCSATRASACSASRPTRSTSLAVDAFSSDAVPMHLLTREALRVYGRAVQRDGLVLFHISNRYLDLKPVVADIAAREGWTGAVLEYVPTEEEEVLQRHPLGLDRAVAQPGDDRPAGAAERRGQHELDDAASRNAASPAGPTTTPRSCRSSTSTI